MFVSQVFFVQRHAEPTAKRVHDATLIGTRSRIYSRSAPREATVRQRAAIPFGSVMVVLLVEDHADTRGVLATLLNRCGCRTVTAKNARDARARLEEMRFDVLISDLNLPDGDGLDLVREAKQKQTLKAIALTGRATPEERRAGMEAGFDYYLTKPIDFHELRQALDCGPARSGAHNE